MTAELLTGFTDVTIERDVELAMQDGVVLRSDIYRPKTNADLPVVLMRLPYDKRSAASSFVQAHPSWYASQGYIVVAQDVRGRYASDGEFYPFENETSDGVASIEWASKLPGSTGKVGMNGFSYMGQTQLLAARERPQGLAAIAPGFTASQLYDGWTYNSGALALAFSTTWSMFLALETAARNGDAAALGTLGQSIGIAPDLAWVLPLEAYPPLQDSHAPYFFDWLEHNTYDDYWSRWSIDADYSRINVPAIHIGGWYDIFLTGTTKNFNGLREGAGAAVARDNQKLLLGPWAHMPWTPIGSFEAEAPTSIDMDDWHIRWFDQFLKGEDRGVLDSPVTVHLLDGGWRDYDEWPPPQAVDEQWFFHSDGRANSKFGDGTLTRAAPGDERPDLFIYDPAVPTPSIGGHSCCLNSITPMGRADQNTIEVSQMVLVYTSEPATADFDIVGNVEVSLYAASSAIDTDFTARLCIVSPDGVSTNLQEGIVRARYRDSLTDPTMITPGEVYGFTITLGPVGARIAAGSRIRVNVASSDFPQWDRNLNTGGPTTGEGRMSAKLATQTVLHNSAYPSHITIPTMR